MPTHAPKYVETVARSSSADKPPYLRTLHDKPAAQVFSGNQTFAETTHLGNGFMGVTLYGGATDETILVNEKTLWSGGTGANPEYSGGTPRQSKDVTISALQRIRENLQETVTKYSEALMTFAGDDVTSDYPENIQSFANEAKRGDIVRDIESNLFGEREDFGSYMELGRIHIVNPMTADDTDFSDYTRSLNLENSIATICYAHKGVNIKKEYFVNYPQNIFAMWFTASCPITQKIFLSSPQPRACFTIEDGHTLCMSGQPAGHGEDGLFYYQKLRVIPISGNLTQDGDGLMIRDTTEFVLIMAAGTNYQQSMDDKFNFFFDKCKAHDVVQNRLNAAIAMGYNALLENHINDYTALFSRLDFKLDDAPQTPPTAITPDLIASYKGGEADSGTLADSRYLEILAFQYGRYLLIASSRQGSLPANLQGVWATELHSPWEADYHTNINVQMNYWPAGSTNLIETQAPLVEYIRAKVPRGKQTAAYLHSRPNSPPNRGWTLYLSSNIWAHTMPESYFEAAYAPAGGAWLATHVFEQFLFTQDLGFLRENYDIIAEAAIFWVDNLWTDERDGTYVSNPSFSPERGPYTLGATQDMGIIWEIFEAAIQANKMLGGTNRLNDTQEIEEIRAAQANLSPPKIGRSGYFMEWKDETKIDRLGVHYGVEAGGHTHRHVNHLYMLHPGTKIVPGRSQQEDAWTDAMRVTLNTRGDAGTGWSRAWKINFWARLRDGERAYNLYRNALKDATLPNLFSTHPPFQIDGNFGNTAGIAEMLLQSHAGYIELLPALPQKSWPNGHVSGMLARGNTEVDIYWKHGTLERAVLRPRVTGELTIKYPAIGHFNMTDKNGNAVACQQITPDVRCFNAEADQEYTIA